MFTPGRQMSPFDINMAADAGYQLLPTYTEVALDGVHGLTQDAIFSRGPSGVARTGIFIGGRDVMLAAVMLDAAKKAMVPPFVVSVMADPSGSYTTAAALVACVEQQLRKVHGEEFAGKRVTILGGTGTVGRIAGVLAAQLGATVRLSSHLGEATARKAADETNARFGSTLGAVLEDLEGRFPGIRFRMIDGQLRMRRHIRFFVNGAQTFDLAMPLRAADELCIVQALSGG